MIENESLLAKKLMKWGLAKRRLTMNKFRLGFLNDMKNYDLTNDLTKAEKLRLAYEFKAF